MPNGAGSIHGNAFEIGADHQLTVGAIQIQLQLIRNHPRHWQWLRDTQPVGEFLHFDLPGCRHPSLELAGTAIGEDLRSHRFVECARGDVLPAQPFGAVKAEIALELSQLQLRLSQLQAPIGGFEVDEDFRLVATLVQRDIELELALQIPGPFPTGKGFTCADRRVLKNFQSITEAAGKAAIEIHVRVLSSRHMRDIDEHIADLSVEQLPLVSPDPHATVFDEHVTTDLADVRPARLEGQFSVMHFEEQTDAAVGLTGILAQRALILEETLVDCTFEDCCTQPLVERRAQDFGQVFGRVATIALDQTDPQVHVVFLAMVEMQANQEVAGNLALFAEHLQVRSDQGETVFIEFPGQTGVGLKVLPWLGENRVEVQDKILAVHAQFATVEVAAEAAADVSCCRRAVIGVETDVIQVGGETEFVAVGSVGAKIQQHIA